MWTGATVPLEVTHISPNGTVAYELPVPVPMNAQYEGAIHDQLVLGDNETGFVLNGQTLVSFNVNSGAVNWSYESPVALSLLASSAGGGTAAQEVSAADTVLRFDASGNVTVDSWSASGVNNFGGSLWLGYTNNGAAGYSAAPVELSSSSWYAPDGNGGNAAIQDISVPDFSQAGPNQTTEMGVVNELLSALPLTAFPGSGGCYSWLQSGDAGSNALSLLRTAYDGAPAGWGHGTVYKGGKQYVNNNAFSGKENPDRTLITTIPDGVLTTVNDIGGFFNQGFGDKIGTRGYKPATLPAQAEILLHEMGHVVVTPTGGFQKDFGGSGDARAGRANDITVENNCSKMIVTLPSITSISPASGGQGAVVTITGTNLGSSQGSSTVAFGGVAPGFTGAAAAPTSWTEVNGITTITVPVPSGASTGSIVVTVSGVPAVSASFTAQ